MKKKSFLIHFRAHRKGNYRGAAIIDLAISEEDLVALVGDDGGDPACKHCRGAVVAEKIRDLAYELKIAPSGALEASVHDVSADPRVTESHKHRLLKKREHDFVESIVQGIATSGAVH